MESPNAAVRLVCVRPSCVFDEVIRHHLVTFFVIRLLALSVHLPRHVDRRQRCREECHPHKMSPRVCEPCRHRETPTDDKRSDCASNRLESVELKTALTAMLKVKELAIAKCSGPGIASRTTVSSSLLSICLIPYSRAGKISCAP